jgi:hypothetical protein
MRSASSVACALAAALAAGGCFTTTCLKSAVVNLPGRFSFTAGAMGSEDGAAAVVEARAGLLPRIDIGARYDSISTSADVRLQPLSAEAGAPLDCAIEVGVGVSGWTAFRYGGIFFSRDFDGLIPILGYRYVDGSMDESDADDDNNDFARKLIIELMKAPYPVDEIFAGLEIELTDEISVVGEVLYIPSFKEDYWQLNVGMKVKM